jgi:glycosyltransferase involved in cell wall biosynthesis
MQEEVNFELLEILVYSDGSRDRTVQIVNKIKDPRVKLFIGTDRLGQQYCQNQMIATFRGDLLALVEADTVPYDNFTLSNLAKPYLGSKKGKIGMVVGRDMVVKPKTFFENIVYRWDDIKQKAFDCYKNGDNLYNAGGHTMRLISCNFAKKLHFPDDVPEDCYAYLRLKELGFKLQRVQSAIVLAKSISSPAERSSHSLRFYEGKINLQKYFASDFIRTEYCVPKLLICKQILFSFFDSPVFTVLSIFEFFFNTLAVVNLNTGFSIKSRFLTLKP